MLFVIGEDNDATACAFSRGCCEVNGTVVNTVCGGLFKHSFKTNIPLRLETRGSQEPFYSNFDNLH
jgi:hypothetical protein